jgi:hypothetical protein
MESQCRAILDGLRILDLPGLSQAGLKGKEKATAPISGFQMCFRDNTL